MLTLTNALSLEGYTVYEDDNNDPGAGPARFDVGTEEDPSGSGRRLTIDHRVDQPQQSAVKMFYVLPNQPTIAKDENGQPIFSLIVYRQDETRISPDKSREDVGGGILTFTVELDVPKEAMTKIRERLRTLIASRRSSSGGETPEVQVEVLPVQFLDGIVGVAVAGEGTGEGGEFVKSAVGSGKVSGIGGNRKAVMVKLTQSGAALMSQISKLRTLPINVQYDLSFEHRLLGVTLQVWCDVYASYTLFQEITKDRLTQEHEGYTDSADTEEKNVIRKSTESMIQQKTMGVKVTPQSSAVDQETLTALEKYGLDLLTQELNKVVQVAKTKDAGVTRETVTGYISEAGSNFNMTLDRKMVLRRTYNPSANISNIFQGQSSEEMISYVDLRVGFFSFLKVPIRVNADFAKLPIDSVVVTVHYERARLGATESGAGSSEREVRRDSFAFTDGSAIQTFLAYANTLDELTYDWTATVHYKGSQLSYTMNREGARENFLVVDVGMLGMLQVDVGLGLVDLERFPAALVTLRYRSQALGKVVEQSFQLTKEKQTAMWTEIVQEDPRRGYEYKVDWLRKDGDILPGEWQRETSSRLRVSAPVGDQLQVSIVATGNFKEEISQVAVSLVYKDEDNGYEQEGSFSFTDDKQVLSWTVDLRNPELRSYKYHYSIIYKDGVVKSVPPDENDWLKGEPGFIVVGEKYGLEVDVVPLLLTFPDHAKLVQVDLIYDDPAHQISERKSFVFSKDNNKGVTWRVRTDPSGPKSYVVEITYYAASGERLKLPPRVTDAQALVLEAVAPPAPPAPAVPGGTGGVTNIPR